MPITQTKLTSADIALANTYSKNLKSRTTESLKSAQISLRTSVERHQENTKNRNATVEEQREFNLHYLRLQCINKAIQNRQVDNQLLQQSRLAYQETSNTRNLLSF